MVESDFLVDIRVGGVVLLFVGEGVRDGAEAVEVAGSCPPDQQRVQLSTCCGPVITCGGARPQISTGTQRLLKLERSIRRIIVLDTAAIASSPSSVSTGCTFDVAVSIVTHFRKVSAASIHLGVDGWDPVTDVVHVLGADTEGSAIGIVDIGFQKHIIDLGVEIDTAVSGIEPTGDPGNPGVLQIIRGRAPSRIERDKESHLLTTVKVIDDSCGGITSGDRVGSKGSYLLRSRGVADGSWVMPQSFCADARTGAQTRCREITDVGE